MAREDGFQRETKKETILRKKKIRQSLRQLYLSVLKNSISLFLFSPIVVVNIIPIKTEFQKKNKGKTANIYRNCLTKSKEGIESTVRKKEDETKPKRDRRVKWKIRRPVAHDQ